MYRTGFQVAEYSCHSVATCSRVAQVASRLLPCTDVMTHVGICWWWRQQTRVKKLFKSPDTALVQFRSADRTLVAKDYLNGCPLFGSPLRVNSSTHFSISLSSVRCFVRVVGPRLDALLAFYLNLTPVLDWDCFKLCCSSGAAYSIWRCFANGFESRMALGSALLNVCMYVCVNQAAEHGPGEAPLTQDFSSSPLHRFVVLGG